VLRPVHETSQPDPVLARLEEHPTCIPSYVDKRSSAAEQKSNNQSLGRPWGRPWQVHDACHGGVVHISGALADQASDRVAQVDLDPC